MDEDPRNQFNVKVLKYSSYILIFGGFFFVLALLLDTPFNPTDLIPVSSVIVVSIFSLILIEKDKVRIAGIFMTVMLWLSIVYTFYWKGGIYNPLFLITIMTIVIAGLVLNPLWVIILTTLNILNSLLLFLLEINSPSNFRLIYKPLTILLVHIPSYALIGLVMYYFNKTILHQTIQIQEEQQASKTSDIRYKMLIEQAGDPIIVSDKDDNILEVNQAAAKLLHYSESELLDLKMNDIIVEKEYPENITVETLKLVPGIITEREFIRSDGTRIFVEANAKLLPDNTIQGIFRDIQERKAKEKRNLIEQEKNSQDAKMQALGKMAGGITHDFNNLLSAIYGYTDYALTVEKHSVDIEESLEGIKKAAEKGKSFVEELLKIARRQKVVVETIDLDEEISKLKFFLERLISDNVSLHYHLSANSKIELSLNHLNQILINLIINSDESITGKGEIEIFTSTMSGDKINELYKLGVFQSTNWVVLKVKDDGPGIHPDDLEHIFDPFYTTKSYGSGLGLSTVYGIIQQNQGYVRVDSELEEGCTFTIIFPKVSEFSSSKNKEEERQFEERKTHYHEKKLSNLSILLVEDEKTVRQSLVKNLTSYGITVYEADNGEKGIQFIDDNPHISLDLIITDIKMPILNGDEMMQVIRTKIPDIECIFISGYPHREIFDELISADSRKKIHFMQKPFKFEKLIKKIQALISKENKPS